MKAPVRPRHVAPAPDVLRPARTAAGAIFAAVTAMHLVALAATVAMPARAAGPDAAGQAQEAHRQARAALQRGRLDEAELLLERALMLAPDHAEATLDLALLMARRGRVDAARALLQALADDPRTPAPYRTRLNELVAALPPATSEPGAAQRAAQPASARDAGPSAPGDAPPPRWRAEAQLGRFANPLARTSAQDITLSLPDGFVTLPVASRPQPGTVAGLGLRRVSGAAGVDGAWQHLGGQPGGEPAGQGAQGGHGATAYRLTAWGPWPTPRTATAPLGWVVSTQRGFDAQRRHTLALTAIVRPLPPTTVQSKVMSKSSLHTGSMLGAGPAARLALGAYLEPGQPDRGLFLRAEHPRPAGLGGLHALVSAELSRSTAGSRGHLALAWVGERALGPGARIQLQAVWQQDLHGYSPLLDEGARRRMFSAQVAWTQQLGTLVGMGARHPLQARLFAAWRHSNLALFSYRDAGAQVAWVWQW